LTPLSQTFFRNADKKRQKGFTVLNKSIGSLSKQHIQLASEVFSCTRFDPISGNWVLYSPNRTQRPSDYPRTDHSSSRKDSCPFCVGQESSTPPSIWVGKKTNTGFSYLHRHSDEPHINDEGWLVRVFANLFPAVSGTEPSRAIAHYPNTDLQISAVGSHEVIVDTRAHSNRMSDVTIDESQLVYRAIHHRLMTLGAERSIQYISVFKNSGGSAGASLEHSHWQLLGTNFVPSYVTQTLDRMQQYERHHGTCLVCSLTNTEVSQKKRIVLRSNLLTAYCPFASEFPMQVRITPNLHTPDFTSSTEKILDECAIFTRKLILILQDIYPDASYNLILSNLPPKTSSAFSAFHWTIDLYPRLSNFAGFEIATRNMINCVMPENAATFYRGGLKKLSTR